MLRPGSPDLDFDIVDRTTGAYTEAYLHSCLQEELHRTVAADGDVAILVIQFDGLDELEKYYGASARTHFMTDAAEFLKANVRRLDVVARYGETGFGIILPYAGFNVSVVRERLSQKTSAWVPSHTQGRSVVTVSVGEAWSPQNGRSASELMGAAASSVSTVAC